MNKIISQIRALRNPILERYLNKCNHKNYTKHFRETKYDAVYFIKCNDCGQKEIV